MNDYNGFKKIAQQNVLSTDEACEILGRTRQQLKMGIFFGALTFFFCQNKYIRNVFENITKY